MPFTEEQHRQMRKEWKEDARRKLFNSLPKDDRFKISAWWPSYYTNDEISARIFNQLSSTAQNKFIKFNKESKGYAVKLPKTDTEELEERISKLKADEGRAQYIRKYGSPLPGGKRTFKKSTKKRTFKKSAKRGGGRTMSDVMRAHIVTFSDKSEEAVVLKNNPIGTLAVFMPDNQLGMRVYEILKVGDKKTLVTLPWRDDDIYENLERLGYYRGGNNDDKEKLNRLAKARNLHLETIEKLKEEKRQLGSQFKQQKLLDFTKEALNAVNNKLQKYQQQIALTLNRKFKDMKAPGVGSDILDNVWTQATKGGAHIKTHKTRKSRK